MQVPVFGLGGEGESFTITSSTISSIHAESFSHSKMFGIWGYVGETRYLIHPKTFGNYEEAEELMLMFREAIFGKNIKETNPELYL